MFDIVRFWMDLGIDGFRLDAVPYLFEEEGTNCENLPADARVPRQAARDGRRGVPRARAAGRGQPAALGGRGLLRHRGRPRSARCASTSPSCRGSTTRCARRRPRRSSTCWPTPRRSRRAPSGAPSCATTTSSPSRWSRRRSASRCTAGTPPTRGCARTSASAAGWRRCWTTRRAEIELIHALLLSLPGSPVPLLRRRDRHGRQHLAQRPRRGAHADAVDTGPQLGLLQRRPGQALPAGDLQPRLPLQQHQRRGPDRLAAPRCCTGCAGCSQIRSRHPVFGLGSFEVCPAENDTILAFLRTVDGGEFDDVEPETVLCVNNMSSRPQASVDPAARPAQGCRGRRPLRRQRLPLGHGRGDADHHDGLAGLLLAAADPGRQP